MYYKAEAWSRTIYVEHIKRVWPGGKIISTTQPVSSIWYDHEIGFHNANSDGVELCVVYS